MSTSSLDRLAVEPSLEGAPGDGAESAVSPFGILLATDGSSAASSAAQFLQLLPLPAGSRINVVTVLPWTTKRPPQSLLGAEQVWATRTVEQAAQSLRRDGVSLQTETPRGDPAQEVIRAVAAFRADLVALGAQGHGALEHLLLGSVAGKVSKHAPCPVLLARSPRYGLKRVVLALDESPHAAEALRLAARLPLPPACEVVVCRVIQPDTYAGFGAEGVPEMAEFIRESREALQKEAKQQTEAACRMLTQNGRTATPSVREGDPAREILALAQAQQADLIIAGARGVSRIEGLLVGSVADRLQRMADCSVLLVREWRC